MPGAGLAASTICDSAKQAKKSGTRRKMLPNSEYLSGSLTQGIIVDLRCMNCFICFVSADGNSCFPFTNGFWSARCTKSEFFSQLPFLLAVLIQASDVKALAGNGFRQSDLFPPTHWSVVLAAGRDEAESEVAQAALGELCQTYWPPLYSFVRSRGYNVHDAQDLTQSFFAYLIEHKIYVHVDRQKGKFRSFLLASLKNFLSHAFDRERTLKRGSGQKLLPLHEEQAKEAESLFQTHSSASSEDRVFERSWAAALVNAALERLSADYKGESKEKLFKELRPFLGGGAGPPPTYAELTVRLGMPESTLRSHVTRLRACYREVLHAEVRRTVETEAQAQEELHELLRVLTES
jgi:RNA polymerase sigma-70 factor (ECF subfamily)